MAEERDTEYVQVRTPDIMRISEYVIKAKGINRTMAQFAEDCGIGASTLSRIANGKISKPLSEDTVKAIFIEPLKARLIWICLCWQMV